MIACLRRVRRHVRRHWHWHAFAVGCAVSAGVPWLPLDAAPGVSAFPPGAVSIPEPSSLLILAAAAGVAVLFRR